MVLISLFRNLIIVAPASGTPLIELEVPEMEDLGPWISSISPHTLTQNLNGSITWQLQWQWSKGGSVDTSHASRHGTDAQLALDLNLLRVGLVRHLDGADPYLANAWAGSSANPWPEGGPGFDKEVFCPGNSCGSPVLAGEDCQNLDFQPLSNTLMGAFGDLDDLEAGDSPSRWPAWAFTSPHELACQVWTRFSFLSRLGVEKVFCSGSATRPTL